MDIQTIGRRIQSMIMQYNDKARELVTELSQLKEKSEKLDNELSQMRTRRDEIKAIKNEIESQEIDAEMKKNILRKIVPYYKDLNPDAVGGKRTHTKSEYNTSSKARPTLARLKAMASEYNIKGRSTMNKAQLISVMRHTLRK